MGSNIGGCWADVNASRGFSQTYKSPLMKGTCRKLKNSVAAGLRCGMIVAPDAGPFDLLRSHPRGRDKTSADNVMAYAIFKTGGKQYKASVGDFVDVEKLEVAEGETASFDQVLAAGEGADIKIGAPTVAGATVEFKVLKQFKAAKVTAFKFKKRKGYHLTKGHRQPLTRVQVVSINA